MSRKHIHATIGIFLIFAGGTFATSGLAPNNHVLEASRAAVLTLVLAPLWLAAVWPEETRARIRNFFRAETDPINLAVFRVVVFSLLLLQVNRETLMWFAALPTDLLFAPPGWEVIIPRLPLTPRSVELAYYGFAISCLFALVGLFTRRSAAVAVVLGIFVLGVPQFFGKINHYHHLIWFAALLAASPCGDALSLDAIRSSWRRADAGETAPPGPSEAHARPIRFAWLLMGVIYFFPGFWKVMMQGIAWGWSDNLKYHLHLKWMELNGWLPVVRLDELPLFYKVAGVSTLAFELGFIFLVFFRKTRPVAAVAGLAFHNATFLMMRIGFVTLQAMYVTFLDWKRALETAGHWLFPEQLLVRYDGECSFCRRAIATLRVLDVFGRIEWQTGADERFEASSSGRVVAGYFAYQEIAWRTPALWPLLPLMYLRPIPQIGNRVYRRVAAQRTCKMPASILVARQRPLRSRTSRGITWIGGGLIAANVVCGFLLIDSWPVARYPHFAFRPGPTMRVSTLEFVTPNGTIEVSPWFNSDWFPAGEERRAGLLRAIEGESNPDRRMAQYRALWQLWSRVDSVAGGASAMRVYTQDILTDPAKRGCPAADRQVVFGFGFGS